MSKIITLEDDLISFSTLNKYEVGTKFEIKNHLSHITDSHGIIVFKYNIKDIGCVGICIIIQDNNIYKLKYYENLKIKPNYHLETKERNIKKSKMAVEVYINYTYKNDGRYEEVSNNITYEDLMDDELEKAYKAISCGNLYEIDIKKQSTAILKYKNDNGALILYKEMKFFNNTIGEHDWVEWVTFPK